MAIGTSMEARSWFDRATEQFRARRIEEALQLFDEAERCGYLPDECAAARWECWMLLGEFEHAWAESDAIALRGSPDPHRFWDGEPFTGKRVIVRCLHGLGDSIQFIRYAPLLKREAQRVIVECHPELVRLLRCADGVDEVITWGDNASPNQPEWDTQVEVNEFPRIFRTRPQTIPNTVPYLRVEHSPSAPKPNKQIGVIWNASQWNNARSIPLDRLLSTLHRIPWTLFSLQFGYDGHELQSPVPCHSDVVETAAAMMNLDLIITVDTMTAHLAGALGRPVWVLLPFEADWRWMLNRSDSPWYPTMRLFRQHAQGDWSRALEQLGRAAITF